MAASAGVGAFANMAGQQQQNITDGKPAPTNVAASTITQDLAAAQAAASAVSATTVSTTDGGQQIAPLESAYNTAVNKLVADLQARDAYLQWEVGQTSSSTSDRQTWGNEINANTQMINDIQKGTGLPHDGVVATGTVAGPGGIVDGSKNPGSLGRPSPSGWGAAGAAASLAASTPNCAGGYVAPPAIPPNADMNQVVGNLTNDQAYFLGWSLSQMLAGKQVAVPPQDAQAWGAMQQWMLTNNPYFTGKGMPSSTPQNTQNAMNLTALATGQCTKMSPEQIIELVMGAITSVAMVPGAGGLGIAEGAAETGVQVAGRASLTAETRAGSEAGETSGTSAVAAAEEASPTGNTAYLQDSAAQPKFTTQDLPAGTTWVSSGDRPLFGASGPQAADASQGEVGDCWFAATLQNLAERNPQLLKDNIVKTGEDTYKVGFFDRSGNKIWVNIDDKLPQSGDGSQTFMGAANGPSWAALYEKAAAKLQSYQSKLPEDDGYDALIAGKGDVAARMLLGPNPSADNAYYEIGANGSWVADDGTQATPAAMSDLQGSLTKWSADNNPNAPGFAWFRTEDNTAGLTGHEYSISSYDPATNTITLRNPWGHNDNLPPGAQESVDGAEITMPLDKFMDVGGGLEIH